MKKNYKGYILYGLLILVIGTLIFSITGLPIKNKTGIDDKLPEKKTNELAFKTISTGDTSQGAVSIELTPIGFSNGQLKVKISANTHSVSLEQFDLKEIITLEYNGKSVKPSAAPILGGHHSSGELIFKVDENIKEFSIKIKGIPKVEERVFEWG